MKKIYNDMLPECKDCEACMTFGFPATRGDYNCERSIIEAERNTYELNFRRYRAINMVAEYFFQKLHEDDDWTVEKEIKGDCPPLSVLRYKRSQSVIPIIKLMKKILSSQDFVFLEKTYAYYKHIVLGEGSK